MLSAIKETVALIPPTASATKESVVLTKFCSLPFELNPNTDWSGPIRICLSWSVGSKLYPFSTLDPFRLLFAVKKARSASSTLKAIKLRRNLGSR
jgi:hypothetical protein